LVPEELVLEEPVKLTALHPVKMTDRNAVKARVRTERWKRKRLCAKGFTCRESAEVAKMLTAPSSAIGLPAEGRCVDSQVND